MLYSRLTFAGKVEHFDFDVFRYCAVEIAFSTYSSCELRFHWGSRWMSSLVKDDSVISFKKSNVNGAAWVIYLQ